MNKKEQEILNLTTKVKRIILDKNLSTFKKVLAVQRNSIIKVLNSFKKKESSYKPLEARK